MRMYSVHVTKFICLILLKGCVISMKKFILAQFSLFFANFSYLDQFYSVI